MRQFFSVKADFPDTLLLFRMGDFYELFFEDAQTAAPVLGVALDEDAGTQAVLELLEQARRGSPGWPS